MCDGGWPTRAVLNGVSRAHHSRSRAPLGVGRRPAAAMRSSGAAWRVAGARENSGTRGEHMRAGGARQGEALPRRPRPARLLRMRRCPEAPALG